MKKYFFRIIRDLLESYRIKREYLRPVGPFIARNIAVRDIVVSAVTEEDINALEVFLSSGDYTKHKSRLQAQKEGLVDYLIVRGIVPLGHLLIVWNGGEDGPLSDRENNEPFIEDVYVHPVARNRGIGILLMDEAEKIVRQRGFDRVGLTVALNNPRVEAMYVKRGYADSGLGTFESKRIFMDKKGRRKHWTSTVKYLVKDL